MKYKKLKNYFPPNRFYYSRIVEIDYSSETSYDHAERCANDYCRFATIEDARVTSVNLVNFTEVIVANFPKNLQTKKLMYVTDRFLRVHKVYDPEKWEISVSGGYYGEEVNDVYLSNYDELNLEYTKFAELSFNEQMEYLLEKEYGFILSSLKNKDFDVYSVDLSDVAVGNECYHKKVESHEFYKDYPYPLCLLLQEDIHKYRLIDGYHRFLVNKKDKFYAVVAKQIL